MYVRSNNPQISNPLAPPLITLLALVTLLLVSACAPSPTGQTLFLQTCSSCHATSGDTVIVGPSLADIATRADTVVASMDAREYILQSITDPSAYIMPGFKDLMPKSFDTYFGGQELQELVEYLLTLK
jgi:nitric oxide reductase subunit C